MVILKELLKELDSEISNTRQCSIIWELGNMGSKAEKASSTLGKILKEDTDWRRRSFAAWSLGRIGGKKAQKALENVVKRKEEEDIVLHGVKWALYWLKVRLECIATEGPCTIEELQAITGGRSIAIPKL